MKEKLLVLGMGSPSDQKGFDALRLDGKTVDDYFAASDIKRYHHPRTDGNLVTSIHRTTETALDYAHDMRNIVVQGHRLSCVLTGGLTFAMPGVVAAEAPNVPIVAVGTDYDAFLNVYKIPDGTPVGVVETGNLEKGIRAAERILNLEPRGSVNLIVSGDCPSAPALRNYLHRFVNNVREIPSTDQGSFDGLTVCLAADFGYLPQLDERVEFGVFGLEKVHHSHHAADSPKFVSNSVYIGRPKNLALYAARVVGLTDPDMQDKLIAFRLEESVKYPPREPMKVEHFR